MISKLTLALFYTLATTDGGTVPDAAESSAVTLQNLAYPRKNTGYLLFRSQTGEPAFGEAGPGGHPPTVEGSEVRVVNRLGVRAIFRLQSTHRCHGGTCVEVARTAHEGRATIIENDRGQLVLPAGFRYLIVRDRDSTLENDEFGFVDIRGQRAEVTMHPTTLTVGIYLMTKQWPMGLRGRDGGAGCEIERCNDPIPPSGGSFFVVRRP